MKKVSFENKDFDFIFEDIEEIKSLLKGERIKIPFNYCKHEIFVLECNNSIKARKERFYYDEIPEGNIPRINFSPECLGDFLENKHKLNTTADGKFNISIYAPDRYNNKKYLPQ